MHVRQLHPVFPLALAFGLLFAPGCGSSGVSGGTPTRVVIPTATVLPSPGAGTFTGRGNRVQPTPNLEKMPAAFHIEYRGQGPFVAELRTADGARADTTRQASVFTLGSTQQGPYSADVKADILVPGPFLIDIRCSGDWEISVRQ